VLDYSALARLTPSGSPYGRCSSDRWTVRIPAIAVWKHLWIWWVVLDYSALARLTPAGSPCGRFPIAGGELRDAEFRAFPAVHFLVGRAGFEPATNSLKVATATTTEYASLRSATINH